jgi:polyisoprenoid-binding protein YceI
MHNSRLWQLLAFAAVLQVFPVAAAPLKADLSKSTVDAVFRQMNVPVEARFGKFSAQIDFDGSKPDAGKATIEIDISSFDLGDPDYNREVLKKEWFNGAQFPKAYFVSSKIKSAGPGKLDVAGKLTIKGKAMDVSFPLSVKNQGAMQLFEGSLPIRRLAFNIGEGEWKDTSLVADEVVIKFKVFAGK